MVTHKDIARAIANAYDPSIEDNPTAPLVRFYRADGLSVVREGEAQYVSSYNPLTKRLKVMLYPHHDMIGLFYLG